jgi:uncharacterized protein (DUF2141 family)
MMRSVSNRVVLGVVGLFSLSWISPAIAQSLTGRLTLEIMGLENTDGNVCIKLFSGSEGFPNQDDSAVLKECVPIEDAEDTEDIEMTVTFDDLPYGSYGVALYHDENGDEIFNRGAFGIPTEGYGFSNDAPATGAPARYEDAIFLLAGQNTTLQINVRYPD